MKAIMKLTFLGTGTSHGVPAIDCMLNDYALCPQGVCLASLTDPKHLRKRCSLLIETQGKVILIDTSLDFREQMLSHRVKHIDAVLLTHAHSDHIGGMPDIRSYSRDPEALPVYGSEETMGLIRKRFDYIFNPPAILGGGIPALKSIALNNFESFNLFNLNVTGIKVKHGSMEGCYGYRIGNIGYIPDIKSMSPEAKSRFRNLDLLILNALRRAPEHPTHLTLPESIRLSKELNPKFCYLTHMSHDIHYQIDGSNLPKNIMFAYDGLQILIKSEDNLEH